MFKIGEKMKFLIEKLLGIKPKKYRVLLKYQDGSFHVFKTTHNLTDAQDTANFLLNAPGGKVKAVEIIEFKTVNFKSK